MSEKPEALVTVEVRDQVGYLTINRPKALNALNGGVLRALGTATEQIESRSDVRVVVVRGSGDKAFVAGADITQMADMDAVAGAHFSRFGQEVFNRIEAMRFPVICAVQGFALGGGCELALACDLIYASERARFGQPEVKLGLIPGFGGTVRLARKIGSNAARDWIFTGDVFKADEAQRVGLVQRVFSHETFWDEVHKLAVRMTKMGPVAVQTAKKVMACTTTLRVRDALEVEASSFGGISGSDEMREGTTAFMEKREPNFKGG